MFVSSLFLVILVQAALAAVFVFVVAVAVAIAFSFSFFNQFLLVVTLTLHHISAGGGDPGQAVQLKQPYFYIKSKIENGRGTRGHSDFAVLLRRKGGTTTKTTAITPNPSDS